MYVKAIFSRELPQIKCYRRSSKKDTLTHNLKVTRKSMLPKEESETEVYRYESPVERGVF